MDLMKTPFSQIFKPLVQRGFLAFISVRDKKNDKISISVVEKEDLKICILIFIKIFGSLWTEEKKRKLTISNNQNKHIWIFILQFNVHNNFVI